MGRKSNFKAGTREDTIDAIASRIHGNVHSVWINDPMLEYTSDCMRTGINTELLAERSPALEPFFELHPQGANFSNTDVAAAIVKEIESKPKTRIAFEKAYVNHGFPNLKAYAKRVAYSIRVQLAHYRLKVEAFVEAGTEPPDEFKTIYDLYNVHVDKKSTPSRRKHPFIGFQNDIVDSDAEHEHDEGAADIVAKYFDPCKQEACCLFENGRVLRSKSFVAGATGFLTFVGEGWSFESEIPNTLADGKTLKITPASPTVVARSAQTKAKAKAKGKGKAQGKAPTPAVEGSVEARAEEAPPAPADGGPPAPAGDGAKTKEAAKKAKAELAAEKAKAKAELAAEKAKAKAKAKPAAVAKRPAAADAESEGPVMKKPMKEAAGKEGGEKDPAKPHTVSYTANNNAEITMKSFRRSTEFFHCLKVKIDDGSFSQMCQVTDSTFDCYSDPPKIAMQFMNKIIAHCADLKIVPSRDGLKELKQRFLTDGPEDVDFTDLLGAAAEGLADAAEGLADAVGEKENAESEHPEEDDNPEEEEDAEEDVAEGADYGAAAVDEDEDSSDDSMDIQ